MASKPQIIKLNEIADVIAEKFKGRDIITCYIGSNAATPTASIEALTDGIKSDSIHLPFIKTVHLLLHGPVPFVEEGLQDRAMAYSFFSAENVREAANAGRAFYLPVTLANLESMIGKGRQYEPDVVIMKVTQFEPTGEYSLGLSVEGLHTAIDHASLVIGEYDTSMPFTHGQSVVDARSIDCLVVDENVKPVYAFPGPDFDDLPSKEKRVGELITEHLISDGVTLQVGFGKLTDAVVGTIKEGDFKDLGVHTELYGDGLMELQKMGIVTNQKKGMNVGASVTCLIMGSRELYDFVHMRSGVQMRPAGFTNLEKNIRRNAPFISVNTAIGVDLFGNVWADYIDARRYYGGVGGQPDFVRALNDPKYGTPIIALQSVTDKGESKIVKAHPSGISLTASAYDGVVIVTEYGIADLRGLTAGAKPLAIASIAHPKFREELLRHVYENPLFTKPRGFSPDKTPYGVTLYDGDTKLLDG